MKGSETVTRHLLRPRSHPGLLSVVIPMYNEDAVVEHLRGAIQGFRSSIPCSLEIVLVNNGSTDGTLEQLAEWAVR